jgi:hypothetical protein
MIQWCVPQLGCGLGALGWMDRKADEGVLPGRTATEENAARRRSSVIQAVLQLRDTPLALGGEPVPDVADRGNQRFVLHAQLRP